MTVNIANVRTSKATGKGNAPKDAMLAAVRRWGYAPVDDNEADAIALLHLAIEMATEGV